MNRILSEENLIKAKVVRQLLDDLIASGDIGDELEPAPEPLEPMTKRTGTKWGGFITRPTAR